MTSAKENPAEAALNEVAIAVAEATVDAWLRGEIFADDMVHVRDPKHNE